MTDEKPESGEKPTVEPTKPKTEKSNTIAPEKPKAEPTHERIEGISSVGPHSKPPPTEPTKKRAYHKKPKPKVPRSHIHELLGLD